MNVLRVDVAGWVLRLISGGKVVAERKLGKGEVEQLIEEVSAAYAQPSPNLRAIGRQLYDWLDRAGERVLSKQLTDAHGLGMTLLIAGEPALRNLPWELTAARGGLLADNGGPLFTPVRLVGPPGKAPRRENRPLRLLFMAAASNDGGGREIAQIEEDTENTGIELVIEESGSLAGLADRLRQVPPGWFDVVHLRGSADVDATVGPVLALGDAAASVATPEDVASAIAGGWPRVAVVSGCRATTPAGVPSFAERLVDLGAQTVVSWDGPVDARYASLLTVKLYERLADGDSVETSIAKGRALVLRQEAKRGAADNWHLLRAYTRIGALGSLVTLPKAKGRLQPQRRPHHTLAPRARPPAAAPPPPLSDPPPPAPPAPPTAPPKAGRLRAARRPTAAPPPPPTPPAPLAPPTPPAPPTLPTPPAPPAPPTPPTPPAPPAPPTPPAPPAPPDRPPAPPHAAAERPTPTGPDDPTAIDDGPSPLGQGPVEPDRPHAGPDGTHQASAEHRAPAGPDDAGPADESPAQRAQRWANPTPGKAVAERLRAAQRRSRPATTPPDARRQPPIGPTETGVVEQGPAQDDQPSVSTTGDADRPRSWQRRARAAAEPPDARHGEQLADTADPVGDEPPAAQDGAPPATSAPDSTEAQRPRARARRTKPAPAESRRADPTPSPVDAAPSSQAEAEKPRAWQRRGRPAATQPVQPTPVDPTDLGDTEQPPVQDRQAETEEPRARRRRPTPEQNHAAAGEGHASEPPPADQPAGPAERPEQKPNQDIARGDDFVGRRREVQWALGQLAHGRTGIGGLVIHGMGGLGKSSLAARLAERLPQHRCLIHAGLVDEPALQQLVASGLGPDAAALLANSGTPLAQRLRRLLQAFPAPLLFLFDDFDPNLELSGAGDATAVPDLDSRGRGRLRPGAAHVMQALSEAIRAQGSQSRVLITCRHPLALDGVRGRIGHLGLQGLQGDGLDKMIRRLPRISQRAEDDPVRARAVDLAGGNPTLLRRLDAALVGTMCDARRVIADMEAAVDDFRTAIGAGTLFGALPASARNTLATLTVCRQPVDREVALLVTGGSGNSLDRATGASLIEVGFDPAGTGTSYRVAPVIADLASAALSAELVEAASARAFAHLHTAWMAEGAPRSDDQAIELVRLGLSGGHHERAALIATELISRWLERRSHVTEAVYLAEAVLSVVDHPAIRLFLARAQHLLGDIDAAQASYEQVLANCPPHEGAVRAAVLQELADLAQERAAGDGSPSTSDTPSLSLEMAVARGDWAEAVTCLSGLAEESANKTVLYAQAAWLCGRTNVPVGTAVHTWRRFAKQLPPRHELLAVLGVLAKSVAMSGDGRYLHAADPVMVRALDDVDRNDQDAVNRAFFHALERAGDPRTLYDRFLAGCENLVPPHAWRFDRTQPPPRPAANRQSIDAGIATVISINAPT